MKSKILFIGDHPLSTSGVACQSRWLIQGLLNTGRYSFLCFGGAMRHENYDLITVNPDFVVKPVDGYGTQELLRTTLVTEKPDAILIFTDPRFFMWLFAMSDEIHQVCPLAYNHLWDRSIQDPIPYFNDPIYECCDLLNCINYPTYDMLKDRFPNVNYIPHAVPAELFHPLPDDEILNFKQQLIGKDRLDHFIFLYVSRNAKRKQPGDVLISFKMFLDDLEKKHGHRKASIVFHADPLDAEGMNLFKVVEYLGLVNNVIFSQNRVGFPEMNVIYNVADCIVMKSSAEGFGLSVLEGKMCGKPCIGIKTGGVTRQVEDHETGEQYGVALEPEVKSLVGNQSVFYIMEDFVSNETFSKAMMKMHDMPINERRELSKKCRDHALKNYDINQMIESWDSTLSKTINDWKQGTPTNAPWRIISL